MNLYEPSECSTSSRRTASQKSKRISSFDFPKTPESIVMLAALPRQASCCNAAWVWTGRRVNLPTIRSTTLSVYPLARRRSSSQCQRAASAVELIDNLEDGLLAFFRRGMRHEQPSDQEVRLGAQPFRYE